MLSVKARNAPNIGQAPPMRENLIRRAAEPPSRRVDAPVTRC